MLCNITVFWPIWLGHLPVEAIKCEIDSLLDGSTEDKRLIFVFITLIDDDNIMVNECKKLLQLTWPDCDQMISAKDEVQTLLWSRNITNCPCIEISSNTSTKLSILSSSSLAVPEEDAATLFARAMEAYDRFDLSTAATYFWNVSRKDHQHKSALFNLAGILHMIEYPTLAVHYVEGVLCLDRDDMIAHSFLWALTQSKEASTVGVAAYRRLASAGDCLAASKLAALTGEGSLAIRGDPSYARRIYDDMAETFETKLCARLGYRGPWDLLAMVEEVLATEASPSSAAASAAEVTTLPPKGQWRVLDLGCGSGLCGKVFADFVVPPPPPVVVSAPSTTTSADSNPAVLQVTPTTIPVSIQEELSALIDLSSRKGSDGNPPSLTSSFMAGVDVSLRMVNITAATGYYHAVSRGDLLDALAVFATQCDTHDKNKLLPDTHDVGINGSMETKVVTGCLLHLILAADTFIYVGALGAVFALARRCLVPYGLLVFSIEDLDASPMRMTTFECPPSLSTLPTPPPPPPPLTSSTAIDSQVVVAPLSASEVELIDGEPVGAVPGWGAQLLSSARFAHSHAYIQLLARAHGYTIKACREVVLRTEETVPLQGRMYVLQLL